MAEITKFGASEVSFHIKHDLREIPPGKDYGNESIIPEKSSENYSLLDRCKSAAEANKYRKQIEKECFSYNRKNLVHAVEVVVQCPVDCPPEQKEAFFRETYNYICSTLPMGERCVFVAEVHVDEKHYSPTGEMISKDHLHVMYVPGVPDTKHDGFDFKLCADELTKRAKLREFHPGLQSHLDSKRIKATVYRKKEGDGKTIGLSVKQLKEITEKTGLKIDKSITVEQLAEILKVNRDITIYDKRLKAQLQNREEKIVALSATVTTQDKTISELKSKSSLKDALIERLQGQLRQKDAELSHSKSADLEAKRDNSSLQKQLQKKEQEQQQLIQKANQIIALKDAKIEAVTRDNAKLRQQLKDIQAELNQSKNKIKELEAKSEKQIQPERDSTWGNQNSWGTTNTWGTSSNWSSKATKQEERLW